jgi:hypothetical protein
MAAVMGQSLQSALQAAPQALDPQALEAHAAPSPDVADVATAQLLLLGHAAQALPAHVPSAPAFATSLLVAIVDGHPLQAVSFPLQVPPAHSPSEQALAVSWVDAVAGH